eukprot:119422-Heterocapsa_arctica.AAC.1
MPCVGGSPWQNLNRLRTGGQEKVDAHIRVFDRRSENLARVALECLKHGSSIAIEWPTGCAYWRYSKVLQFLEAFQHQCAKCHDCAMGLNNEH